ncbi:hypothetical protein DVH05_019674 [Phytophthora capsici]|nr:hypothetical protein DVH05_019674 [Phytophthora capsici]
MFTHEKRFRIPSMTDHHIPVCFFMTTNGGYALGSDEYSFGLNPGLCSQDCQWRKHRRSAHLLFLLSSSKMSSAAFQHILSSTVAVLALVSLCSEAQDGSNFYNVSAS